MAELVSFNDAWTRTLSNSFLSNSATSLHWRARLKNSFDIALSHKLSRSGLFTAGGRINSVCVCYTFFRTLNIYNNSIFRISKSDKVPMALCHHWICFESYRVYRFNMAWKAYTGRYINIVLVQNFWTHERYSNRENDGYPGLTTG